MASDRQTGLSAGSRVLVGLRFLSVTGQLGSLAKRSLNKLGSCCSSRCLVCVSAAALPQPCTERRWPVAHPATMLWQGPRSMSLPSPRRRARLLEKPQSFNFSPRLALPRHKTPELQKHGTNVSPGPWNHQGKCDGGDPPTKCIQVWLPRGLKPGPISTLDKSMDRQGGRPPGDLCGFSIEGWLLQRHFERWDRPRLGGSRVTDPLPMEK